MDLETVQIIGSIMATLGVNKALEMFLGRNKTRSESAVQMGGEFRQWAGEAQKRAEAADERLAHMQERFNDLDTAFDRLIARVERCQAGPVCPVRTSDVETLLRRAATDAAEREGRPPPPAG